MLTNVTFQCVAGVLLLAVLRVHGDCIVFKETRGCKANGKVTVQRSCFEKIDVATSGFCKCTNQTYPKNCITDFKSTFGARTCIKVCAALEKEGAIVPVPPVEKEPETYRSDGNAKYRQHGEVCTTDGGVCQTQNGMNSVYCGQDHDEWIDGACVCKPGYCAMFRDSDYTLINLHYVCTRVKAKKNKDNCCSTSVRIGLGDKEDEGYCGKDKELVHATIRRLESDFLCHPAMNAVCKGKSCTCETGCGTYSPKYGFFVCDPSLGNAAASASQPPSLPLLLAVLLLAAGGDRLGGLWCQNENKMFAF